MAIKKININLSLIIYITTLSIALRCFPLSGEEDLSENSNGGYQNFTETTAKHNYSSEEHTVITEDGYILTIFRITKGRNCLSENKRKPVLLMHGLLINSDAFLDAGPSAALAYLLSDSCYDVWVGNQRGNNYGRKHLRLNPDEDTEFWQFSVDEIGSYDVPATIDYILKHTDADRINYIGFSQGCGIFFAMCSERPSYCEKSSVMIALAPAVTIQEEESLPVRIIFYITSRFWGIFDTIGAHELFSKGTFVQEFLHYLCQMSSSWLEKICATCGFVDNYNPGSMSVDTQRQIFNNFLVGTSLNNLARYGQMLTSGKFQKFDYGESRNLEIYNTTEVPVYNISAVTVPVLIIQGRNDKLVNYCDTEILSTKLPNVQELVIVSDPNWTHLDMIYSQNIKTMIFPKIYEYLEKYTESDSSNEVMMITDFDFEIKL